MKAVFNELNCKMVSILILVSGKNMEYSQVIDKSCYEQVATLKKHALQILSTCGQNTLK